MKKVSLLLVCAVFAFGFQTPKPVTPKQKTLKVELTSEQWNSVLQSIDQSISPHIKVKEIEELIWSQLQKQVSDTTKPKK